MLKFNKTEITALFDAVQTQISTVLQEGAAPFDKEVRVLLALQDKLLETEKVDMKPTEKGVRGRIGHIGPKGEQLNENLNEYVQLLDKVRYDNDPGYIIGQVEGKVLVQVQGSTYLVDPNQVKEWRKKPDLETKPHIKFDENTLKLLFEQFVKCGIYHGNVPIRLNDCYVRYSSWEKATDDQQVRVLVEGNTVFFPKMQVRILEDINTFANPDNYIPGVFIDELTGESTGENILIDAIDYTNAVGDSDMVKIIIELPDGTQEFQTAPKSKIKTLSV